MKACLAGGRYAGVTVTVPSLPHERIGFGNPFEVYKFKRIEVRNGKPVAVYAPRKL